MQIPPAPHRHTADGEKAIPKHEAPKSPVMHPP